MTMKFIVSLCITVVSLHGFSAFASLPNENSAHVEQLNSRYKKLNAKIVNHDDAELVKTELKLLDDELYSEAVHHETILQPSTLIHIACTNPSCGGCTNRVCNRQE